MAETELSAASVEGLSYPFKDAKAREDIETLKKSVEELAGKEETDPTVPAWAKAASKPSYTAGEVGADPAGSAADTLASAKAYADQKVSAHNADTAAHNDMRLELQALASRLNALADCDDATLDQMAEVAAYIKANRTLIEGVTTSKVNVSDIVDNLTTNVANKPLSAAQGVALKALVDDLGSGKLDSSALPSAIESALAQAAESGEFDGSDGRTPVRGTDYWTEADKAEIKSYVDEAILGGEW